MPVLLYSSPMKYKNPDTGNYVNIIGVSGNPGNGITSIVLNNDYTLTINYTNGTSTTTASVRGPSGVSITSVTKTGTSGLVDTYTITYSDNTTSTFNVTNGAPPSFSIGTVTEGAQAAATITGTDANPVLNLVLPEADIGNLILIQDTQPTDPQNKIWINANQPTTVNIPTVAEMNAAIANAMPAPGADGTALISVGNEWVRESGYGYAGDPTVESRVLFDDFSGDSNFFISHGTNASMPITDRIELIIDNGDPYLYTVTSATYEGYVFEPVDSNAPADEIKIGYDPHGTFCEIYLNSATTIVVKELQDTYIGIDDKYLPIRRGVAMESVAEGSFTQATMAAAHAEGIHTTAAGYGAHAEGVDSIAAGNYSHAEGNETQALSAASHAEGSYTIAHNTNSHAEGVGSQAFGYGSHAEGYNTVANGEFQHVFGRMNVPNTWPQWVANTAYQVGDKVINPYNTPYICTQANSDSIWIDGHWRYMPYLDYIEIVGNGGITTPVARNARALDWDGNEYLMGDVYVGCNADSSGGVKLTRLSDVQINSTSILSNGIANIPLGSTSAAGVVQVGAGLQILSDKIAINPASTAEIKAGTVENSPIVPNTQHTAVFYGLAKVAGDNTQAASSNPVGSYTDGAKTAIRTMIGAAALADIPSAPVQDVQVNGTSVLSQGVANVPVASADDYGVTKVGAGLNINSSGQVYIQAPSTAAIKAGSSYNNAVVTVRQHESVFYGLAKAAGVDLANETVTLGTYPAASKTAIQAMLGIPTMAEIIAAVHASYPAAEEAVF